MVNNNSIEDFRPTVSRRERAILLVAVLIISVCALSYELVVATLSSYLLGDSVTQFSFTIGFFLFAMGIGSLLSRRIKRHTLRWFIIVELAIAFFGGSSAVLLYATFSMADVFYTIVMLCVSLAIGICIGLEIPLLTRIVADRESLSEALADVLSIDYIGALIGSLAFPIILLPLFGVTLTAFLMALFNLTVASICLWTFREKLAPEWQRNLGIASLSLAAFMILGAFLSFDITKILEQQLYSANIVYSEQSPYQRIIITSRGEDYRLFINGALQFSTVDEYRYHEVLVHPVMSASRSHERILVLGGGDGMVVRELLRYSDVAEIILVDLDPAITNLARNFPLLERLNEDSLDDPRVTVINQDAYKYIEETTGIFNVIIIDLPDPNNESLSKLYSDTFYRLLALRLSPDGAFVTQATSPYFSRRSFWTIARTIEAANFEIIPLHTYVPTFGEWGFVLGTKYRLESLSLPNFPLRYLNVDILNLIQIFDPDIADASDYNRVNTLDNPILPRFYEEDWRRWE